MGGRKDFRGDCTNHAGNKKPVQDESLLARVSGRFACNILVRRPAANGEQWRRSPADWRAQTSREQPAKRPAENPPKRENSDGQRIFLVPRPESKTVRRLANLLGFLARETLNNAPAKAAVR